MTTSTHPLITRPGGYSAKNTRRVGAPNNHQGSGESPMVGNTVSAADLAMFDQIRAAITNPALRPAQRNYAGDVIGTDFHALADVIVRTVGENMMVGTNSPVPRSVLWDLLKAMTRVMIHVRRENSAEPVTEPRRRGCPATADGSHLVGCVTRADLCDAAVALSTEGSTLRVEINQVRAAHVALRGEYSRLWSERDMIARESDLREQDIIALTVERDKALDRVAELESALRRAGYGAGER